jgi:hypothetical protein
VVLDDEAKRFEHIVFQSNGDSEFHPTYLVLPPFGSIILSGNEVNGGIIQ